MALYNPRSPVTRFFTSFFFHFLRFFTSCVIVIKRKLDIDPLSALLRSIDDDAPPETYKEVVGKLKTMVDEVQSRKKARLDVSIAALTLPPLC